MSDESGYTNSESLLSAIERFNHRMREDALKVRHLRAENERLRTALDAVRKFLPLTAFVSVNYCEERVYPRSIAEEALESTNEKGNG